jgi:hypothetical protein
MKKYLLAISAVLALAGCADPKPDRVASAQCQDMGLAPGTAGYDRCVTEQRNKRLMEEQRREYEQMKQYDQDWKMRRY